MSGRMIGVAALLAVAGSALAQVAVEVELVPDRPPPYYTGESLTIDVWLQSRFPSGVELRHVQFDFSLSDVAIDLGHTFDFSPLPQAVQMNPHPELPVPWLYQSDFAPCGVVPCVPLLAGELRQVGRIQARLPQLPGTFEIDARNPTVALRTVSGAVIDWEIPGAASGEWTGLGGEIGGVPLPVSVSTQPIPVMSTWGLTVAILAILIAGTVAFQRCGGTLNTHSLVGVVAVGAYLLMLASSAFAAPGDILAQIEELSPVIDSGTVHAEGSGTDPVVVFSQVVSSSGAPWLRLHFASVTLSGSSTAGSESFIRLTSLDDGAVQSLDSAGLERWENSSAYFNGDGITDCLRERRTV